MTSEVCYNDERYSCCCEGAESYCLSNDCLLFIQPEPAPVEEPPVEPPKEEERKGSRPSSKKSRTGSGGKRSGSRGSAKESPGRSKSPKGKDKSASPKRKKSVDSAKKSGKGSRGSSPKSPKRGRSGKKGKSPEPEPEPEPEVPTGPPPPEPGSEEWEYVDLPIEDQLAEVLAPYWEAVENTYVASSKSSFRKIRDEREMIIRYFYQIRQDFIKFLKRPDHKQEFVTQWQKVRHFPKTESQKVSLETHKCSGIIKLNCESYVISSILLPTFCMTKLTGDFIFNRNTMRYLMICGRMRRHEQSSMSASTISVRGCGAFVTSGKNKLRRRGTLS